MAGKKNKAKRNDPVFYDLANRVAQTLKENGCQKLGKKEFTKIQKNQVNRMLELEESFRKVICQYKQSDKIYQKFMMYIKIEKGNILSARPFFRERSTVFGAKVSPAFKEDDYQRLKDFTINIKLMEFIIKNWRGKIPAKAQKIVKEHTEVRQKIIENSLPLAINEAMKFYKKTPKGHLNLMDMINICVAGLCIGVDKWEGPFTPTFRTVCLSRMKSNLMELYNQTFIHYYPNDKKIIYKANILKSRNGIKDEDVLLEAINQYLEDDKKDKRQLDMYQLQNLLNGASVVSADQGSDSDDESEVGVYDIYTSDENIEEKVEETDGLIKTLIACKELDIIEIKILRLKGVDL